MKEFIEKLIGRLEERSKEYNSGVRLHGKPEEMLTHEAIEIVNQLAEEYNNGWIPVSSGRLPEENEYVFAFVPNNSTNKIIITPYHDIYYWKNGTITHWKPLPYQPKGENELYRAKSVDGVYQEYNGDWK